MATVLTFKSAEKVEEYINGITLPLVWSVVTKRDYFTFVSMEDIIAGSNTYTMKLAKSESDLKVLIDSQNAIGSVSKIINYSGYWYVLTDEAALASGLTASVTTYKSAESLAIGTGLDVLSGLDDSTAKALPGEILITYGGTYTLIKAVPTTTTILPKGGYYTVIIQA